MMKACAKVDEAIKSDFVLANKDNMIDKDNIIDKYKYILFTHKNNKKK